MKHSDTLLIKQCLQGQQQAQFHLYEKYATTMFYSAKRILKDEMLAEDVMQESFLKAFQKLDTFNHEAPFDAWLRRIVINDSISKYRKLKRKRTEDWEDHSYEISNEIGSAANFDSEEVWMAEIIKKCIDSLKDNYKMALNLHLIEGYEYREVAEMMDISYNNARTIISRAKEQVRQKIENYESTAF